MAKSLAQFERELDLTRNDVVNHAKTLTVFTERLDDIARWQRDKDIEDARREEREKAIVTRLSSITRLGWAILTTLISGFGLAAINYVVNGGFRLG